MPFLIQMSGCPGSGKSTLSSHLSTRLPNGATTINHDLLRSFFLESSITFSQAARMAYGLQWSLAEDLIKQSNFQSETGKGGGSVIIDSTCNYEETLRNGRELVGRHEETGWRYVYVECKVGDLGALDERMRERERCGERLRSQRGGVDVAPWDQEGGKEMSKEENRRLFERWMGNAVRPAREEGVVVVDSLVMGPEECVEFVMERICGIGKGGDESGGKA